jgi:transcriptional regulator with XRE-family HTH domain
MSGMKNPDDIASGFCALLKDKRIEMGLSHEELAVRSGLDRSTISLYEAGKRVPTLSSAARIAKALETPLSKLIRDAEG